MKKQTRLRKEWRKFELVVSRLEELLTPQGYRFKSPDKLVDNDTGKLREVDCSITDVATGTIVSMECRRRGKKQDILWIEQLACKRESLGLAGTIAVCSAGFSKSAQVKAQKRGITLKTYREIADPSFLVDVRDGPQIRHLVQTGRLLQLVYETDEEEQTVGEEAQARLVSCVESAQGTAVLLRNTKTGEGFTVEQVTKSCLSQMMDARVGVCSRECRIEFPPKTISLEPIGAVLHLRSLTVTLEVEVTPRTMENPRLFRYGGHEGITLQVVSADTQTVEWGPVRFQMVFSTQ